MHNHDEHVVASDVKTAWERRKRKSCRKASVKFDDLVMLVTIEKPKDKGKVDANTIMLDLVDRSDEVVVGTTDRVVKARIVYRVPKEQRDGARDVRSTGNESWQQTSAEIAAGVLVNAACVARIRSTGKVMELREDKARWFCISERQQNSRSVDSPKIARDVVWQRQETRCRDLMARSAESTSEWL